MKTTKQKFIAVYKKNENNVTKVDILTGWQLDSKMASNSYKDSIDYVSPIGACYTPNEYRIGRKVV